MLDDDYDDVITAALPAPKKPRPHVDYQSLYQTVGQKYGVDPDLLYRQAKHESVNFNPHFVFGPGRSPKGAAGIAQFMPQTARQYGLYVGKGRDDRFDPVKSADAHGRLMKDLIDRYKDPQLALAAYNSGTNRTPQSARRAMHRIPETRNYVQKLAPTQDDGYDDIVSAVIPKTAATPTPTPQADSYDDVIAAATQKRVNPFARARAGVRGMQQTAPRDRFALLKAINAQPVPPSPDDALREQAVSNVTGFTIDPVANVRSLIGAARRGTQAQVDTEAEEEFQNLKAAQARSRTPEMTAIRKEYGQMAPATRSIAAPLARVGGDVLKVTGGLTSLAGLTPNKFSEWANKRGQIVQEGASLAPLSAADEEIKRGLPEKVVTALADTGLSIAEIVALKKATGLPLGRLLALETALKTSDEPLAKRAPQVAESASLGRILQSHLSRPASAVLFGAPTAARQGQSYLQGGTSLEDAILQTAVQTTVGGVMGGKPKGVDVSVPERPETIKAQLDARGYSLAPKGAPRPSIPQGYQAEKTADGIVFYDPNRIDRETIRNTPTTELLGHVEPKSETTTEAVVTRAPDGTEIQSSAVSPENVGKQAEVMAAQYPEAKIETGGPELAADVIAERAQPQRFQHLQFGEVEVLPDQTGARPGRVKVAEVDDPTKQHFVRRADAQGRGNARMIPSRPEVPPVRPAESPVEPAEIPQPEAAQPAESTTTAPLPTETRASAKAREIFDKFDDTGEFTKGDVVNELEKHEMLPDAVAAYRSAQIYSREIGERMDVTGEVFEKEILPKLQELASGAPPKPEQPKAAASQAFIDVTPVLNATTAKDVISIGGRMIAEATTNEELAQVQRAMQQRHGELSAAPTEPLIEAKAAPAPSELPSATMFKSPTAPQDRGVYQGKPFWIGTVNMLDGKIENVYTREQAEAAGSQHERYMRPADVEGINSGERAMFWIDSKGQVQSEWRNKPIPPELKAQVEQQIQREGQAVAPTEPLVEEKPATRGEPQYAQEAVVTPPATSIEEGGFGGIPAPSTAKGEAGFLKPKIAKEGIYEPATSPILKEVERTTQGGDAQRPSLRQYARRAKSYVQRSLIAEFTPLRELEQTLYGKESVPIVNMARKFEQVAGAPGKAQADFIDFKQNVIDPIRKSADDFNSYLFLKRVEDRLLKEPERKRVAEWTVEKAQAGLAELEAKVGADTYKELAKAGKVYQKEMDKALRLQVESGRMSQELYDTIKESSDFYAPFKVLRYIEDSDIVRGSGRRIATMQELSKKIKGIDSEDFQLGNILQASAEQIVRSRILAEKNLKMLELDKLADLDPKGDLIKRITEDKARPDQGKEFVRFLKDGKEQVLEVDQVVADAVQGLNAKQASLMAKTMMFARKPLQVGATSANAGFQAVNLFFADLPRAALVSRYGVRNIRDVYQFPMDWTYSLFTSMKGNFGRPNQLYMDWLRSGAANSTIQRELTPEAFRPTLGIAKPGAKHLAKSVLNSVAQFSNAIEETSKIIGIKRGMKAEQVAKMSPAERQQAMEKIATEVRNYSGSPDFARKGSETRDLNLLFMFFNARLQGVTSDITRLAGKSGTKEGATAWARLGITIGLPSALLAIVNNSPGNKEDYDKIPDWEKKNYWMIPRDSYFKNEDTGETVRDYWRIPKRELGQLIGNTTESAVQFGMSRDPKVGKAWAVDMVENLSPINIQGRTAGERLESIFGSTNPALKLPAESLMNRDTFRHRAIVPEYMRKAAPEEQYRESTPRGYVAAGKALGISPLQLEHAAEGLTGSAASQFSVREQQPGRSVLGRFPLTKRFVRSGQTAQDDTQTQEQTDYATKQLQRRRARQEAVKKYRAGEISKADLDKLEEEDTLTESDVKRVQKEAGLTNSQQRFSAIPPNVALDRFERMDAKQRNEVVSLMEHKAYTLLNSPALTDAQKEAFKARIEALGITPRDPRKKAGGFKSAFGKGFARNQFAQP